MCHLSVAFHENMPYIYITAIVNLTVIVGFILSSLLTKIALKCMIYLCFRCLHSEVGACKAYLKAAPPQGNLQCEK